MPDPIVLPEFARWINPLIRALTELGGSARPREVVEKIAQTERVPDETLDQVNPAGGLRFPNQVHWARFYLADEGYIDRSSRGVWKLTESGSHLGSLSDLDVLQLIERVQGRPRQRQVAPIALPENGDQLHARAAEPVDEMEAIGTVAEVQVVAPDIAPPDQTEADYRSKLLSILQGLSPSGFERLCQRLLREAGFEQVVVTGKSGDGGIDGHGVLSLNPFVSFRVLFQCKRYSGSVSPAQVRDFRGAMQGRADKGLILTTGAFTVEARREGSRDGAPPIELVDGEKLIDLFAKLELGLNAVSTYDVDEGFFSEYR